MSRLTYTADMADENKTKQSAAGGIVEHLCEHPGCKVWGGFGYMPSKAVPPRWWCWEHYPYQQPGSTR